MRKLIYNIIIPSFASFIFGVLLSVGVITNLVIFIYTMVMTAAALLASTGKGRNGDAPSTLFMGFLVGLATYLLISVLGDLFASFHWFFIVKTIGFMIATAAAVVFGRMVMEKGKEDDEYEEEEEE